MGGRTEIFKDVNPDKLKEAIATAVELGVAERTFYRPILSSRMSAQEVFDAIPYTSGYSMYVQQVFHDSFVRPGTDEWDRFRTLAKGRLNELVAGEILREQCPINSVIVDCSGGLPILGEMFPASTVTDYGMGLYSVDEGEKSLPSTDFWELTLNGNVSLMAETSTQTKLGYWRKKVKKSLEAIVVFDRAADLADLKEVFCKTKVGLVATAMEKRQFNQMSKLMAHKTRKSRVSVIKLPYSSEEFDEFFQGFLPKEPFNIVEPLEKVSAIA